MSPRWDSSVPLRRPTFEEQLDEAEWAEGPEVEAKLAPLRHVFETEDPSEALRLLRTAVTQVADGMCEADTADENTEKIEELLHIVGVLWGEGDRLQQLRRQR